MLYYLYELFDINIFQYTTFRAIVSFILGFFLSVTLMPRFIAWANKANKSQPISDFAPKNHKQKGKIPTMGGVVFFATSIITSLLTARLGTMVVIDALLVMSLFTYIGYKDDISKILEDSNAGMSSKTKFMYQLVFAFIVSCMLYFNDFSTDLYIPFMKNSLFDMHIFAILFWTFVIVATSNAVNLTDGLDGLATVPSILSFATLGIFLFLSGNVVLSNYLLIPNIEYSGEVMIVVTSLIGSLIGFLWYNSFPATVFMGDSGSLMLGAFMGYVAIVAKEEFLLVFTGFIFVMETISVILQVGSFKLRNGKRIFLMAPIHHHFEMKGWSENKVIVRFWIIAVVANLIAIASIKLR